MKKLTSADEEKDLLDTKKMIVKHLHTLTPGSTDFQNTLSQLNDVHTMLIELRARKNKVEPWIPVFGHIGGITLMSMVEMFGHTWTSKAMTLVKPMK